MTTYDGPATATADDTEYHVTAHLTLTSGGGGLKEWYGSIEAQDEEAAWTIAESRDAKLRISDGRDGSFFADRSAAGSTDMTIQGSGRPPFGD